MKKFIKFTVLLGLVLALISVASAAESKPVCPCCGVALDSIQWKTMGATKTLSGHYRATEDGKLPSSYSISSDVTIDLNGCELTTKENNRVFYSTIGTVTLFDSVGGGSIAADGASDSNGGVFRVGSKSTLNIYGGTYYGAELGEGLKGGVVRVEGTVNMYGGTLTGGKTQDHGGNVSISSGVFNLYGGTVCNGEATGPGRGGNFYLGVIAQLNVYGGTVSGGRSAGVGGNVFAYSGSSVTIYGGTFSDGYGYDGGHDVYIAGAQSGKYSSLDIFGGTIGNKANSLKRYSTDYSINIYNGSFFDDPSEYLADCSCIYEQDGRYIVWNYGLRDEVCSESCPMAAAAEKVATLYTGQHYYVGAAEPNTCLCDRCGFTYRNSRVVAVANGIAYTDLTETSGTVDLVSDVTLDEYVVNGTLNLNGYTLNATAVTGATGNIIDTTQGKGKIQTPSISLSEKNTYLAVREEETYRFATLTPDTTLERLDSDTVRIRFIFEEKAADTLLDEVVLSGNQDISVVFHLTWKNSAGAKKTKTYVCDPALLYKYAQKWDGRRFVATITGVEDVTNLTCTVRLEANGVISSAPVLKNYDQFKNVLSWENINSYPLKTKDMTVEEMRQLCIDFFEYSKTFLWTPDESVDYIRNSNDSEDSMEQGTVYGGMPYVGSAGGTPYRLMDYIDPVTGLMDMKKALPALENGGQLTMQDLKYFGSQCAKTAALGWCRVINSANLSATMYFVPSQGAIILGDIEMDETISYWTSKYSTSTVCKANGTDVMYEAYALLQKADGLVQYNTAGHVIMAYSDPVVVRNEDGTINGEESYIYIIHQAQKWIDQENTEGDQFQMKSSINSKMTFASLYSGIYIPFTFKEFHGQASIQDTTLTLTAGDGTVLVNGTIQEEDRSFFVADQAETMTFSQVCGGTVKSNYGVSDVYVIFYNSRGQELYRHAVRTSANSKTSLKMAAEGEMVTVWEYAKLESGETYKAEILVQSTTGERTVIYAGEMKYDR